MNPKRSRKDRYPSVVAWGLTLVIVLSLLLLTQHVVGVAWRDSEKSAQRELSNLSRLSQEHAERTLNAADQALQLVRALYLREGNALKLSDWVRQGAIDVDVFHQVGIIDAQGIYRLSNLPSTPQVDLSDREHFRVHLERPDVGLFVSKPVLGRVSKKWTVQLTRRIDLPDGRFGGVAVVSVDAEYFSNFYSRLDLGADGAVALVGTDGLVRARHGKVAVDMGVSVQGSPATKMLAQGKTEGLFEAVSPVDRVARLHHFRLIPGYSLYVVVGWGVNDYRAHYQEMKFMYWLMACVAGALTLCLAALFSWQRSREMRQRQALQASQARTELALDSGGIGIWEWDLRKGGFTLDKRLWAMLGFADGEMRSDNTGFLKRVHPDDVQAVARLLPPVLKGEVPRLLFEHRVQHKDGHWIWLMARGQVVERDAQGRAVRLMGTDVDRTAQKRAEENLRVAAVAFASSSAMMISAADQTILRVNPAFEALSGYSAAECVGQHSNLLKSDRHPEAFYQSMWAELTGSTGHWEGEIWNRRKSGEVFPDWVAITGVRDERGQITHYVSVHADITLRKRSEEEIKKLAFYDPLTGLANRRLLLDRLQQMRATLARQGQIGAVLFMDLDRFKRLNDTHGHALGDELLIQVGQRLQACVREGDTVARLGGDEFVVALAQLGTDQDAVRASALGVAQKIRDAIDHPFQLTGLDWQPTLSMGVALLLDARESVEDWLKHADAAMYAAKAAGRNNVQLHRNERTG